MTTKKILATLAGTVCMLAFFASSALAKEWESTSGKYPRRFQVEGKRQQKFTFGGATIECRTARGRGQLAAPSKDLQYRPKFEKCTTTITGVKHVTKVEVKECQFRLILTEGTGGKQQGEIEIKNIKPNICRITITVEKPIECKLQIGAQGPLKGFRAEQIDKGKEREVQIEAKVGGIKVDAKECPLLKGTEGKYEGKGRIVGVPAERGIKIRKS